MSPSVPAAVVAPKPRGTASTGGAARGVAQRPDAENAESVADGSDRINRNNCESGEQSKGSAKGIITAASSSKISHNNPKETSYCTKGSIINEDILNGEEDCGRGRSSGGSNRWNTEAAFHNPRNFRNSVLHQLKSADVVAVRTVEELFLTDTSACARVEDCSQNGSSRESSDAGGFQVVRRKRRFLVPKFWYLKGFGVKLRKQVLVPLCSLYNVPVPPRPHAPRDVIQVRKSAVNLAQSAPGIAQSAPVASVAELGSRLFPKDPVFLWRILQEARHGRNHRVMTMMEAFRKQMLARRVDTLPVAGPRRKQSEGLSRAAPRKQDPRLTSGSKKTAVKEAEDCLARSGKIRVIGKNRRGAGSAVCGGGTPGVCQAPPPTPAQVPTPRGESERKSTERTKYRAARRAVSRCALLSAAPVPGIMTTKGRRRLCQQKVQENRRLLAEGNWLVKKQNKKVRRTAAEQKSEQMGFRRRKSRRARRADDGLYREPRPEPFDLVMRNSQRFERRLKRSLRRQREYEEDTNLRRRKCSKPVRQRCAVNRHAWVSGDEVDEAAHDGQMGNNFVVLDTTSTLSSDFWGRDEPGIAQVLLPTDCGETPSSCSPNIDAEDDDRGGKPSASCVVGGRPCSGVTRAKGRDPGSLRDWSLEASSGTLQEEWNEGSWRRKARFDGRRRGPKGRRHGRRREPTASASEKGPRWGRKDQGDAHSHPTRWGRKDGARAYRSTCALMEEDDLDAGGHGRDDWLSSRAAESSSSKVREISSFPGCGISQDWRAKPFFTRQKPQRVWNSVRKSRPEEEQEAQTRKPGVSVEIAVLDAKRVGTRPMARPRPPRRVGAAAGALPVASSAEVKVDAAGRKDDDGRLRYQARPSKSDVALSQDVIAKTVFRTVCGVEASGVVAGTLSKTVPRVEASEVIDEAIARMVAQVMTQIAEDAQSKLSTDPQPPRMTTCSAGPAAPGGEAAPRRYTISIVSPRGSRDCLDADSSAVSSPKTSVRETHHEQRLAASSLAALPHGSTLGRSLTAVVTISQPDGAQNLVRSCETSATSAASLNDMASDVTSIQVFEDESGGLLDSGTSSAVSAGGCRRAPASPASWPALAMHPRLTRPASYSQLPLRKTAQVHGSGGQARVMSLARTWSRGLAQGVCSIPPPVRSFKTAPEVRSKTRSRDKKDELHLIDADDQVLRPPVEELFGKLLNAEPISICGGDTARNETCKPSSSKASSSCCVQGSSPRGAERERGESAGDTESLEAAAVVGSPRPEEGWPTSTTTLPILLCDAPVEPPLSKTSDAKAPAKKGQAANTTPAKSSAESREDRRQHKEALSAAEVVAALEKSLLSKGLDERSEGTRDEFRGEVVAIDNFCDFLDMSSIHSLQNSVHSTQSSLILGKKTCSPSGDRNEDGMSDASWEDLGEERDL